MSETIDEWVAKYRIKSMRLQVTLEKIRMAREYNRPDLITDEDIELLRASEEWVKYFIQVEKEWLLHNVIPKRDKEFQRKFARYLIYGEEL